MSGSILADTYFFTSYDMGSITDVECTATCTNCSDECCCNSNCNTTSNGCAQQTTTKYSIATTGEVSFWYVTAGISAGWESETSTTSTCNVTCSSCGTAECWVGFVDTETWYDYVRRDSDYPYTAYVVKTCKKHEKTATSGSSTDGC